MTILLIQCPLITWAKFNCHGHQCQLMTSFYHPQFHCSIGMEVGQIFGCTFSNVSKINDFSPLQLQKCNRRKYDTQTKMVSCDLGILGKTHATPDCDLCDLCPQLTFDQLFPTVTQYHKTAPTVSPNELDQISLSWALMPPVTTFHHPQLNCSI